MTFISNAVIAVTDLQKLFNRIDIPLRLGIYDIAQRYRHSKLGPIWLTISMLITVLGMGLVFGVIFASPLKEFLPFLALGMIIWSLLTSILTEGCNVFILSEGIMKQTSLPYFSYIFQMVWRNIIIFAHNIIILPVFFLFFLIPPKLSLLLFPLGFLLFVLNLTWMATILAVFCTRFRDFSQIVINFLQLCFFVTPIIWSPQLMEEKGRTVFLTINPFYHLIEIVRAPILGNYPSLENWKLAMIMAVMGWSFTLIFFGRFKNRIAYWL